MKTIFYPAIFTPYEDQYTVTFPDLHECITQGNSQEDAYAQAIDALGICLEDYLENSKRFPVPSDISNIKLGKDEYMVLIRFNMEEYKNRTSKELVKKTLTLPSWINQLAIDKGFNFSEVLKNALLEELELK